VYQYCKLWLELKVDKRAVTILEYCLIAAAVGTVLIGGFTAFGGRLTTAFGNVAVVAPAPGV